MPRADVLVCADHPARTAVARCDRCGKPVCEDCRVEDVASDEVFCSSTCRADRQKVDGRGTLASNRALLDAYQNPIRNGWKLWGRSLGALSLHVAPLALAMAFVVQLAGNEADGTMSDGAAMILLVAFAFGIALTQVILSKKHSGLVAGNPYVWAAKRFIPWALTLVIAFAIGILGFVALIVPGIFLSLRLFWADEFALVHRANPVAALKESWELTEGQAGLLFGFQFLAGLAAYGVMIVAILFAAGVGVVINLAVPTPMLAIVQMALAFSVVFIGYGGLHAPEIVYLYGMRAERALSLADSTKTLGIS